MGRYLELARQVNYQPPTSTGPEDGERETIRAALRRLNYGETEVVRFYSRTCGGQMLVLGADTVPESIIVDCPTFAMSELRELIGMDKKHVQAVYELKHVFPKTTVEVKS